MTFFCGFVDFFLAMVVIVIAVAVIVAAAAFCPVVGYVLIETS